jgi:hypothetical protein
MFNRVGEIMAKANTVTFHSMVSALQTGNDDTYGAGYRDPNEPSSPNLKTDVTFDSDVNALNTLIGNANTYHQSRITQFTTSYFASNSHTYDDDTYDAWLGNGSSTGIAAFQIALKKRITEISNRIGYLNGKGSQTGGIADGGSGTQSSNSGTAGSGFVGTSFNGGNGYANTIYSHANFLAGKKINLVAKILKAVEGVTDIYTQIKAKRAEYYEFNQ